MRLHIASLALVVVAGHAQAQDYVRWGNGGSIHGAESVTVTDDDRAVISVRRGANTLDNVILTLENGSFDALLDLSRRRIVELQETVGAPESVCMDAGWDFIERQIDDGVIRFDGFGCPDPAVEAAFKDLNKFIDLATVE